MLGSTPPHRDSPSPKQHTYFSESSQRFLEFLEERKAGGRARYRTLGERAFGILKEGIVTGAFNPGQRLRIEELAAALDMSPPPVREALSQLDAIGLVNRNPHRGVHVAALSIDDLSEITELRVMLETLAIHRAAAGFREEDTTIARESLARHREATERNALSELLDAHTDFHFALYAAGRYPWLLRLIRPLWESAERYRYAVYEQREVRERDREHERILQACIDHDSQRAARALRDHILGTATRIASQLGAPGLFGDRSSWARAPLNIGSGHSVDDWRGPTS